MAPVTQINGNPEHIRQCASDLKLVAVQPIPNALKGQGAVTCALDINGHKEFVDTANECTKKLLEFVTRFEEAVSALSKFATDAAANYHFTDEHLKDQLKVAFDQFTRDSFAKMTGADLPTILPELDNHGGQ
ncbi:hypothetical protein ORV05_08755 [Amycolatopsis cynarae]|uniref:Uncharacterized protein n=1 Tax=Amycolatopsis cynarae TaxID=2995223 RepID=A0ABY7B7C6_9PSEU|nr:hypothetical protein [Amycolatopsis sp. HUAS 11-8]WAL67844.1 hypothetical protein ORV05_08755 [Amycolatopsis sp. HUAS 11-8]